MGSSSKTLDVPFLLKDEFVHEYWSNIVKGGVFVATDDTFEVRDRVTVCMKLHFIRKGLTLPGEVVHVVPRELAATGAIPGIAVQFEASPADLRKVFEPVLEKVGSTEPEPEPERPRKPQSAAERRAAPRTRARVRARVHCPGRDVIDGRTRDLSITGVLISIGRADPIEVGEPVKVTITNPQSGAEREIFGKVARHVKGEGEVVRALGIQFYVRDSERKEVERFLRELRATEHSRHLGGIQGEISELGLSSLVQTFALAASEGTLDVMRGAEEGYLAFENGCLRAASLGGTHGIKALARMLTWSSGRFEFHARIDRELPPGEPMPIDGALLEAMRLQDESAEIDRKSFPPDAVVLVDRKARATASELSKVEEAVLDLAGAKMNVQRILDVIPETDDEIYLALWRLAERGIVSTGAA